MGLTTVQRYCAACDIKPVIGTINLLRTKKSTLQKLDYSQTKLIRHLISFGSDPCMPSLSTALNSIAAVNLRSLVYSAETGDQLLVQGDYLAESAVISVSSDLGARAVTLLVRPWAFGIAGVTLQRIPQPQSAHVKRKFNVRGETLNVGDAGVR